MKVYILGELAISVVMVKLLTGVVEYEGVDLETCCSFHNPPYVPLFDFHQLPLVTQLDCLGSSYDTRTGTHIWYI